MDEGVKPCSYITFTKNYTSHIEHKSGIEIEADWSGPTMNYVNFETGETITAYLFVATMPYSKKSYVETTVDMKEQSWLQ